LLQQIAPIVIAFLVGSIPFGVLAGRLHGVDIRTQGSGNIGATNALRVMGWKVGLPVLLLDIAKGLVPVLVVRHCPGADALTVAGTGVAAVLGHCFSPFLGFSGGKGVATALGMILAVDWRVGVIALGAFIVLVGITRFVSLGSVAAAGSMWAISLALHEQVAVTLGFALVGVVVIARHHANIKRLLAGTENKLGSKKREALARENARRDGEVNE
jgi:acyl phosphate:glycerol-3-phosphate acyltransferase